MKNEESIEHVLETVQNREEEAREAYEVNREYNEESTNIERIASNKMNAVDQLETTSNFVPVDIDVDWTLAYHVYQFLKAKTNKLPGFEYIDKIISETDPKSKIISMGYGVIIDTNLTINCTEMITNKKERTDTIKFDSYYAVVGNPDSSRDGTAYVIDVNKYPIYDEKRVKYLQQYLSQYHTYKNQNTSNKVR